jgi:hypothetical protein
MHVAARAAIQGCGIPTGAAAAGSGSSMRRTLARDCSCKARRVERTGLGNRTQRAGQGRRAT